MSWSVDACLPRALLAGPPDALRRARLTIYGVLAAVVVDVISAAFMPGIGSAEDRGLWAGLRVAMHLATLALLRASGSTAIAGNYFTATIFLHSTLQLEASGGFSAFGLVAIPLAATHLIGLWAASGWTLAAAGAASVGPLAVGASWPTPQLGLSISATTLAIGAASILVERSRLRSARDLSAAEAVVQLHRERLRAFLEQIFPVTAEVHDGRLLFVSEGARDILGFSPEEVLAKNVELLRVEDVASFAAHVAEGPGVRIRHEARVRHRDGHWVWMEVFGIPFGAAGESRWLFAARRIDAEVEQRERIDRAQRLEGIGALAAGIAHDFNNLLTVIAGFGARLPESEAREQVLRAASAAGELTGQLLAFGRAVPVDEPIDVERELRALEPLLRSVVGEEIAFALRGGAKDAMARISPGRLQQVVLNLVRNAREATPPGGHVSIELGELELDRERAAALELSAGRYLEIAVLDDGRGMSEEVQRRALDPFYTTKISERGVGLGLASAYGIARRCGGMLALESLEGCGTRARVLLPVAPGAAAGPPEPAAGPRKGRTAATVWVVEDDPRIRALLRDALAADGHATRALPGADEALELLAREGPPDLLVTDIVMPGLRGTALATRLREARPALRVVFFSGYSDVELGPWERDTHGVRFLAKPLRPSELVDAVDALLAE